jgi:cold shock CspA family protein
MFHSERRFGFIIADDGHDYFFHEKDIRDGAGYPEKNAAVEFEVGSNKNGVCARNGSCPGCRGNSACGRATAARLYATASFVSTVWPNALIRSGISR